jgi:hypothetical protein
MKTFTVTEWVRELENRTLSTEEVSSIVEFDIDKVRRLDLLHENIGLPVYTYYAVDGADFSFGNIELSQYFDAHRGDLFSIRAEPKEAADSRATMQRQHGLFRDACFQFVAELKGRAGWYNIKLTEYLNPDLAGTMIATPQGIIIEAVEGIQHMALTQQWVSQDSIILAQFMFPHHQFICNTKSPEIRRTLWGAAQSALINKGQRISLHNPPQILFGYYEFIYSKGKGFRFFDFNNTKFFSSVQLPPGQTNPDWLTQPTDLDWLPQLA